MNDSSPTGAATRLDSSGGREFLLWPHERKLAAPCHAALRGRGITWREEGDADEPLGDWQPLTPWSRPWCQSAASFTLQLSGSTEKRGFLASSFVKGRNPRCDFSTGLYVQPGRLEVFCNWNSIGGVLYKSYFEHYQCFYKKNKKTRGNFNNAWLLKMNFATSVFR